MVYRLSADRLRVRSTSAAVRLAAPAAASMIQPARFVSSPVFGASVAGCSSAGVGVTAAVGSVEGAAEGSGFVLGVGSGFVLGVGSGSVLGVGFGSVLGEGSDSVAYARTNGEKLVVVNSK